MDQQPRICRTHTFEYISMFVIGILIGSGISFVYFSQSSSREGASAYQAGFDAAKKRVENSSFGAIIRTPDEMRVLSGTVTRINGNKIDFHIQSTRPFDEPSLDDRTTTVTSDTKISRLTQKDQKIFQSEMETFMKNSQTKKGATLATPPEPFSHTPAILADIKVGDVLTVSAEENIKTKKEFTATDIQIQPKLINN